MKKRLVSRILATAMAGVMAFSLPVMAEEATEDTAAEETTEANPELADKKVGVCIYQFADNFMTLFRTELENYLVEKGFSKDNIVMVLMTRLHSPIRSTHSSQTALTF